MIDYDVDEQDRRKIRNGILGIKSGVVAMFARMKGGENLIVDVVVYAIRSDGTRLNASDWAHALRGGPLRPEDV